VVRPDYSGSGATVDDGQPLSVEILAAQVVGAARAAGAVPFDLVGFSLGASLATYIAAEYPAEVRSVAVLAGFASGRNSRFKLQFGLWRDLIGGDVGALAKLMVLTGMSPRLPDEPDLRPNPLNLALCHGIQRQLSDARFQCDNTHVTHCSI